MARKYLPLIRITTPKESRLHMIDRDKFTIGRSPEVDILLTSASVSRKHLTVEIKNDEIYVEDHGSSNGTFVNEVKLEAGKKQVVRPRTPIRLGTSTEILTIEIMDRPVEFGEYKDYLPRFNHELQIAVEKSLTDSQSKAEHILKEAQRTATNYSQAAQAQATEYIQKAKTQEKAILEAAQAKAEAVIRSAEKQVADAVEKVRKEAEAQVEVLRQKAQAEVTEFKTARMEQVRKEADHLAAQAIEQARTLAHRELQEKREQAVFQVRDHLNQVKVQAQMEADQILKDAHRDAGLAREAASQEFEKLRLDAQKRAQSIVGEAESEAERLVTQAREASERMRRIAQQDTDEARTRSQQICLEMTESAERESKSLVETAKKKAQVIVENQERESSNILKDLKARIEAEAQKEAQKYIQDVSDQLNKQKAAAHAEITATQNSKALIEESIVSLKKELETLQVRRGNLAEETQSSQLELSRLKEETSRQKSLNEKLAVLEDQLKALELQRAQLAEKNAQTQSELELIKKNTFEELERVRQEEEKKVLRMAATKAKEFSRHIEKVLVQEINLILPQKLNSQEVSNVTSKMSEELTQLFAAESFQHNEKVSLKNPEESVRPSFMNSPFFRVAVLAIVCGVGFYIWKHSENANQQQEKFTQELIQKQKEEVEFKPTMSNDFRGTYTDNVLYMDRYVELKTNPQIQDQWALNLNEFFLKDLKLSEENMVRFIGIESALIKRLVSLRASVDSRFLEEGIERMRQTEKEESAKIMALLQTQDNWNRLRTREKLFLAQAWTTPIRNPAQDPVQVQEKSSAPGEMLGVDDANAPATTVPYQRPAPTKSKKSSKHRY